MVFQAVQHTFKEKELCSFKACESSEEFMIPWRPSPIKCHCFPHIETSQLICTGNQLIGFYMRATMAFNGLIKPLGYQKI